MKSYIILIIGMMVVTYIPRLLPLVILSERPLPPAMRRFLTYIPFTALSALIVRGILQADSQMLLSLIGISVAGLVAWFKGGMVLAVFSSIASTFILLLLFF